MISGMNFNNRNEGFIMDTDDTSTLGASFVGGSHGGAASDSIQDSLSFALQHQQQQHHHHDADLTVADGSNGNQVFLGASLQGRSQEQATLRQVLNQVCQPPPTTTTTSNPIPEQQQQQQQKSQALPSHGPANRQRNSREKRTAAARTNATNNNTPNIASSSSSSSPRRQRLSQQHPNDSTSPTTTTTLPKATQQRPSNVRTSRLVWIHGASGTGKTALVDSLRHYAVIHHSAMFVSGKFDLLRQNNEPYSGLVEAFTDLINLITLIPKEKERRRYQKALRKALDIHDLQLLGHLFYNLHELLPELESMQQDKAVFGSSVLVRLKLTCRRFLKVLATTSSGPIVLFLDDVQWADGDLMAFQQHQQQQQQTEHDMSAHDDGRGSSRMSSLDVIYSLISDPDSQRVLIICATRDEEDGNSTDSKNDDKDEEKCRPKLPGIWLREDVGSTNIMPWTVIHLEGLGLHAVVAMIAQFLSLNSSGTTTSQNDDGERLPFYNDILPLARVILNKTHGNPYFVLQFLQMLRHEGFITKQQSQKEELMTHLTSSGATIPTSSSSVSTGTKSTSAVSKTRIAPMIFTINGHENNSNTSCYFWEWDTNYILQQTNVSDNVADLVESRIQRLSMDVQHILQLASSLGHSFDVELLYVLYRKVKGMFVEGDVANNTDTKEGKLNDVDGDNSNDDKLGMDDKVQFYNSFAVTTKEGLVEKANFNRYKFSHDRVQQALVNLLEQQPNSDRLHLEMGRIALEYSSMTEALDAPVTVGDGPKAVRSPVVPQHQATATETVTTRSPEVFVFGVNQMNLGVNLIEKETREEIDLARWNLHAAKLAIAKSAFLIALRHTRMGFQLLQQSRHSWKAKHYDLTLDLVSTGAELEYSTGNIEESHSLVESILKHSNNLIDKMRGYYIRIDSLGDQGKTSEAIDLCISILDGLGVRIRATYAILAYPALFKAKIALDKAPDEKLLSLPVIQDANKLAIMTVMGRIISYSFYSDSCVVLDTLIVHMVLFTARNGLSDNAPHAFAGFSMLKNMVARYHEGYRFGKFCLTLLQDMQKESALTLWMVNTFSLHWRDPLREAIAPLKRAHILGLHTGNVYCAFQAAFYHAITSFHCGVSLYKVEEYLSSRCAQMKEYNQDTTLCVSLPFLQMLHNLTGRGEFTCALHGEAMDEEVILEQIRVTKNDVANRMVDYCQLVLACHFDEWDVADPDCDVLDDSALVATCLYYFHTFYHGLSSLAAYFDLGKRKYLRRARSALKRLERWVSKDGVINCEPLSALLDAEISSRTQSKKNKKNDDSGKKFQRAINLLKQHGFRFILAMAHERACAHYSAISDRKMAKQEIRKSVEIYASLGTEEKVSRMEAAYSTMLQTGIPNLEITIPQQERQKR